MSVKCMNERLFISSHRIHKAVPCPQSAQSAIMNERNFTSAFLHIKLKFIFSLVNVEEEMQ